MLLVSTKLFPLDAIRFHDSGKLFLHALETHLKPLGDGFLKPLLDRVPDLAKRTFIAAPDSLATRKRVFELPMPKGCTLGGLVRNGEGVLISGSTQIQAGDIVMAFCYNTDMHRVEKLFVK